MNPTPNSLIEEEIKRTGGNLSKVARALGIDYFALRDRQLQKNLALVRRVGVQVPDGPEPEDIRSLGRPGYELYVIAVKRQGDSWPARFATVIADARKKFDIGTHEMFQTVDDGWVVQYLIPRLKPTRRRYFFAAITGVGLT